MTLLIIIFYYYRKLDDGGSSGPSAGGSKLGRHSTTYKNLILKLTQMLKEEINMVCSFLYQCAVISQPCHEKNCHRVSDQVRHKLGCTTTDDDYRLEISDLGSRGIVLSM